MLVADAGSGVAAVGDPVNEHTMRFGAGDWCFA